MAEYDKEIVVGNLTFNLEDGENGIEITVSDELARYEPGHLVGSQTNKYALERLAYEINKFLKGE